MSSRGKKGWSLTKGSRKSVTNEEIPRDRPGRPEIDSQEGTWPQQFVIGNDEAELELSVESRSFVNRVNDQVRKSQKRISNVTENVEKHSMNWWMLMSVTMESAVFMGKNYLNNCRTLQISHLNKCSTYVRDWCVNKMRSLDWKQLVGRIIRGSICH